MIELPPPDLFEGVILGGSGRYMGHDDGYTATTVRRLIAEAVEKERESCAAWIETQRNETPACGFEFAAAIRARTKEPSNG